MSKKTKKIPTRNKSLFGWWVASYIERFEYEDENKKNVNCRCLAWENTILIKAKNRETAYSKALKNAKLGHGSKATNTKTNRNGRWIVEGLTSLLPIYDELEDGSEIIWKEYENITVKKMKSFVKRKNELETFED